MIPDIQMALELAKERCQTLKFLTLTACDGYLGGKPTTEGTNRRRLDFQHLAQWVRRDGGVFEYLLSAVCLWLPPFLASSHPCLASCGLAGNWWRPLGRFLHLTVWPRKGLG